MGGGSRVNCVPPPRPECTMSIYEAICEGLNASMITGNNKDAKKSIGNMLGIIDEHQSEAVIGPELDAKENKQINSAFMDHIFSQDLPQKMFHIVKDFQSQGQVCSIIGDDVNYVTMLRDTDMGMAMVKEGNDVACKSPRTIIACNKFSTIVLAVREGSIVLDHLHKIILFNNPINKNNGFLQSC